LAASQDLPTRQERRTVSHHERGIVKGEEQREDAIESERAEEERRGGEEEQTCFDASASGRSRTGSRTWH
jgi:hypothetical protein